MKNIRIAILATAAIAFAALASAQTTTKLSATKANDYGLVYSLPTTVVDVTIEVEKTAKTPGEFYKYAKKYLNINDPVSRPSETVRVKSVTFTPRGIPNDDERYLVQFKAGASPFMILNEEGVPVAVNTSDIPERTSPELPVARKADPTPLETAAARQVISEEMLQSRSSAKRAELAAAQIYALRQTRSDLLTGQADKMPPDGKSLQLILDNIEAQEQALMAMFCGTESRSTDVATLTVVPGEDEGRFVLARISPVKGIVDADDLSGDPFYVDITATQRGELPVNDKGVELPFPKGGFAYMIPGSGHISASFLDEQVGQADFDAAQYGVVYGLAPNAFVDRKAPIYLIMDPVTGSVLEMGTVND